MKKWYVITAIVCLAVVASVIYINTLNAKLESVQSALNLTQGVLASTQADLISTKQTLISTQAELGSTKQIVASTKLELTSTKQSLSSTQTELTSSKQQLSSVQSDLSSIKTKMDAVDAKLKLYEDTMGIKIYASVQPGFQRGNNLSIMRLNNSATAANPSWQQLVSFLGADRTEDNPYDINSFDCVDYAEMLHNKAEAAGIKSAFVAVNFKNDPVGHTVNAFVTTDRGLVYIDDTGTQGRQGADTIAYLSKDKELGFIGLGQNTSFDYAYYEKMNADLKSYDQKLTAYNRDVQTYNSAYEAEQRRRASLTPQQRLNEDLAALQRRISNLSQPRPSQNIYPVGTPEWFDFMDTSIDVQKRVLDSLQAELKDFDWLPMGIVESIQIYW